MDLIGHLIVVVGVILTSYCAYRIGYSNGAIKTLKDHQAEMDRWSQELERLRKSSAERDAEMARYRELAQVLADFKRGRSS